MAGGGLKHVLFAKFKDEISPEKVEELATRYSQIVLTIPSVKAFHWGKDVSTENLNQGFTHVFEGTFENMDGVVEYTSNPDMVALTTEFKPALDKYIVLDYTPIIVKP